MTIRYSPSTGNFYPNDIDYGKNLPADAIDVPMDKYNAAMSRPAGASFAIDAKGNLTIIAAPVPLYADIANAHLATVRATREAILNRLAGLGFAALAANDAPTVTAIAAARQGLLDITKAASVMSATTLDALKAAVLSEYRKLTAAAPLTVQKAFQGVDK